MIATFGLGHTSETRDYMETHQSQYMDCSQRRTPLTQRGRYGAYGYMLDEERATDLVEY